MLNQKNFVTYSRMIFNFLEESQGVALCDAGGKPVWTSDEAGRSGMVQTIDSLNQNASGWINSDQIARQRKINQNRTICKRNLIEEFDGLIGVLVVLVNYKDGAQPVERASFIRQTLEIICETVLIEYRLIKEINDLAEELGGRYEEINLIYKTAEEVKNVSEGPRTLQQLVKNCTDYLTVDITVLLLSGKKITSFYENAGNTIPEIEKVIGNLHQLLNWTISENKIVVINDEKDPLKNKVARNVPYKLMSFPILDRNGNVKGVLVTMNHRYRSDFTTGTRNILRVIARKASEVIQSNTDDLTGLMNRPSIEYHIENALTSSRLQGLEHCFLILNIDKMKLINDTTSLAFGDDLIKQVGKIVQGLVRDCDNVARLGGDEFGILLERCSLSQGQRVADKMCSRVSNLSIIWNHNPIEVTASIGLVSILPDSESVLNIIAFAEMACDLAKEEGGNGIRIYQSGEETLSKRQKEMKWVGPIRLALKEDRFHVYCQAIAPLQSKDDPWHYECLLRLHDEKDRPISPDNFLPAAERYQMMPMIDQWVIQRVLELLSKYCDRADFGSKSWSINLSGQSFTDKNFLNFVLRQLKKSRVPAKNICFEITETAAVRNLISAQRFILAIKELGCKFSLDDFGTGLSSFAYLKNLHVDYLKIDGSFIRDILKDKTLDAMVVGINQIGHAMNLKTIAEYTENKPIMDRLRKIGVDFCQGYAVHKPQPLEQMLAEMVDAQAGKK
ncbi:MAG: EAL domain-containing protein [Desulfobacterales bacterium]|nr:EAL domain-containing protein [Desulfobacterales bacterium]